MKRALFVVFAGGLLAGSASSAILWDQGMSTGTYFNAWGNTTGVQYFADIAVFSSTVQVTGYNHFTTDSTTTPGTMTVRVYANGASVPGSLIASQSVAVSGRSQVGSSAVYMWSLNLASIQLAAGTYWFGASYNPNSGGGQVALSGVASPGDGRMALFNGSGFQYVDTGLRDQAFQLVGSPVPEPGTMALCGLALAAAARRRARRV